MPSSSPPKGVRNYLADQLLWSEMISSATRWPSLCQPTGGGGSLRMTWQLAVRSVQITPHPQRGYLISLNSCRPTRLGCIDTVTQKVPPIERGARDEQRQITLPLGHISSHNSILFSILAPSRSPTRLQIMWPSVWISSPAAKPPRPLSPSPCSVFAFIRTM